MSIDVYPPKGLLVPGTEQVTETLAFKSRNTNGNPSDPLGWVDTALTNLLCSWTPPGNYAGGDVMVTVFRTAVAVGGTAMMDYYIQRYRDNTTLTTILFPVASNYTPGDTFGHSFTFTLPAGTLFVGDVAEINVRRDGGHASDTLSAFIICGGMYVTYLATTPRVFNAQPYEEGSFTVTATGFSGTAPSGTARYVKIGKQVSVWLPDLNGTSNVASFTVTGMPASLTPNVTLNVPCSIHRSGVYSPGVVAVNSGSTTLPIYTSDGSAWNASGAKQLQPVYLAYLIA